MALIKLLGNSPLSEDLRVKQVLVHGGSFLNRFKRTVRKRPRLDVETLEGITVRWGTFNTGEFPDEILSDEKMAMLRNLVSRDLAVVPGVSLDVRTRMPGFSLPEQ
jgi:hypothetical protein